MNESRNEAREKRNASDPLSMTLRSMGFDGRLLGWVKKTNNTTVMDIKGQLV